MIINVANLTHLTTFLEYYDVAAGAEGVQCSVYFVILRFLDSAHFRTVPCSLKQKTRKRSTRPDMWGTASAAGILFSAPAIMNIKAKPPPHPPDVSMSVVGPVVGVFRVTGRLPPVSSNQSAGPTSALPG